MDNGVHFISGLPRSGSTLLAGILRQNPRFHAGMTSPVGAMYMALETAMSRRNETAVFIDDLQRRAVLKGLFDSYYGKIHADKVVFDTNRAWCTKLPALGQLFPAARVICCVRHIGWMMDSVERLVRRNAFELSGMFGFESGRYRLHPRQPYRRERRVGRLRTGRAARGVLRGGRPPADPGRISGADASAG